MPNVFISYSRQDRDFAEIVGTRIQSAGFSTWIDLQGLRAGDDWRQAIDDAIRQSAALIVIVTPAAMTSTFVTYEWAFALGAGVSVIPILRAPAKMHLRLEALQRLNFTNDETRPWQDLLDDLQHAIDAQPAHSIPIPRSASPIVKEAVAALDSPDENIMKKAMRRLAEMKLPEAEAAMIEALHHPLLHVRSEAAWHLAERGDVRAVPALIKGNQRWRWGQEFGRKVAKIGLPAIPQLLTALRDESSSIREYLVDALQQIGDPAVVPEMIAVLQDPDPEVRLAAVRALKSFGSPEALSALNDTVPRLILDLQNQDISVSYRARDALEKIGTARALAAVEEWNREE